ncbi:MAG: DUF2141 domain-containing protein [Brevundimonas sp.]|uniref:DUF2141 domain-containing protein n=1 Tax=Brevundimonas sp. TaxID=1871086 RepID=UPI001226F0B0|nr:DUF2141 domain-containing protein [Brevundimonas sp.]RZJ17079.1 MAG: DUF2141 domain-containing protein [Brevundimonas sp.]
MKMLAALALLSLSSVPALADELTVNVDVGATTGDVLIAVFDSQAAYDAGRPMRAVRIDVAGGARSATVDLPTGDYAIKAFHDVDGDGQMNKNPFGMPTEPYAFSNNAKGNMGPAPWGEAQFAVTGATIHALTFR